MGAPWISNGIKTVSVLFSIPFLTSPNTIFASLDCCWTLNWCFQRSYVDPDWHIQIVDQISFLSRRWKNKNQAYYKSMWERPGWYYKLLRACQLGLTEPCQFGVVSDWLSSAGKILLLQTQLHWQNYTFAGIPSFALGSVGGDQWNKVCQHSTAFQIYIDANHTWFPLPA